ncbi:MAG: choice-of-anchor D domain-containing protein [Treponema sp.]|nr:choice-of-anchor D domain-containing protein [Treponema sp.]
MKNILGKTWLVLSIALCSMVILVGCPHFFDQDDFYNPDGKGTFKLYLGGSQTQGRTIMPGTPGNQFAWYRLEFSGGPTALTVDRTFAQISDPVELAPGTYTLTVYAYTSEANRDADKRAAHGTTTINIVGGQVATGTVELEAYGAQSTAYGGKGIFNLNLSFSSIIFPNDFSAVRMRLEKLQPVTQTIIGNTTYNFISGDNLITADANLEIDAGYYRVIFSFERPNMRTVTWHETLHIYENMTSSYSLGITNNHFVRNHYAVTLNYNGNGQPTETNSWFFDEIYKPVDPVWTGWDFAGWFKDNLGDEWTFPQLTENISLTARWYGYPVLSAAPTSISLEQNKSQNEPLPGPQTITITNTGTAPATITSITNSNEDDFTLSGNTFTTIAAGSSETFTIQPEDLERGTYNATITVSYEGGTPVTTRTPVTIPVTFTVLEGAVVSTLELDSTINSVIITEAVLTGNNVQVIEYVLTTSATPPDSGWADLPATRPFNITTGIQSGTYYYVHARAKAVGEYPTGVVTTKSIWTQTQMEISIIFNPLVDPAKALERPSEAIVLTRGAALPEFIITMPSAGFDADSILWILNGEEVPSNGANQWQYILRGSDFDRFTPVNSQLYFEVYKDGILYGLEIPFTVNP